MTDAPAPSNVEVGEAIAQSAGTRTLRVTHRRRGPTRMVCLESVVAWGSAADEEVLPFLATAKQFLREPHPHVATVLELDRVGALGPHVILEDLRGAPLVTGAEPRPEEDVRRIVREAALAIASVHRLGHVLGRISPRSFVLAAPAQRVVLTELPLHPADAEPSDELYAAPEQLAGEAADARTDVFGLGLTALELLVGTEAFQSLRGAMVLGGRELPDDALPSAWRALLGRALRRDPRERHPTIAAFEDELEGILDASSTPAPEALELDLVERRWRLDRPVVEAEVDAAERAAAGGEGPAASSPRGSANPASTPEAAGALTAPLFKPTRSRPLRAVRPSAAWAGIALAVILLAVGFFVAVRVAYPPPDGEAPASVAQRPARVADSVR